MKTFEETFLVLLLIAGFGGTLVFGDCPQSAPGLASQVKCVTKTQFVLGFQDPLTDTLLDCPAGTVCLDVAAVCNAVGPALCANTAVGSNNMCNECKPADTTTSVVCVNTTAYAFCIGGRLSTTMVYPCSSPTPYCKISGQATCVAQAKALDCPLSSGGGNTIPTPAPTPFTCQAAGFFSNPSDRTCRGYYKCQLNTSGGFDMFSYTCSQGGYAFDPVKKSCVIATSFKCPNA